MSKNNRYEAVSSTTTRLSYTMYTHGSRQAVSHIARAYRMAMIANSNQVHRALQHGRVVLTRPSKYLAAYTSHRQLGDQIIVSLIILTTVYRSR